MGGLSVTYLMVVLAFPIGIIALVVYVVHRSARAAALKELGVSGIPPGQLSIERTEDAADSSRPRTSRKRAVRHRLGLGTLRGQRRQPTRRGAIVCRKPKSGSLFLSSAKHSRNDDM